MSKLQVAIAGATGYAGEELIRVLQQHPSVNITLLFASAKWERPVPLREVFPRFSNQLNLSIESLDPAKLANSCDVAFLALPHGVSMDIVPHLIAKGLSVIDLGGDYRLKDAEAFNRWYGKSHSSPELIEKAVYGISELAGDQIAGAQLIANPGCYATSIILGCAPLFKSGLVEPGSVIVDAKSGVTGAGRKASSSLMFSELNENMQAYKVNAHQHVPEIEQALRTMTQDASPSVCFIPQIVPINRGILSTIVLKTIGSVSRDQIKQCYEAFYDKAPFIRIYDENKWPSVRDVAETNYCDIGFTVDENKKLVVISVAIDNLMKGAAGQAVQNLNLMQGWDETMGLLG